MMTRKVVWGIGAVIFALVFLITDGVAGYNAGIVAQWVCVGIAGVVAFGVVLLVAVCICSVSPPAKKSLLKDGEL
jgi:hypothetical protein